MRATTKRKKNRREAEKARICVKKTTYTNKETFLSKIQEWII